MRSRRVGNAMLVPVAPGGAQEADMQEVVGGAAVAEGLGAELEDGLTHLPGGGRRGHRLAEGDGDRQRHALRHLEEEASLLETEDAAPYAVEMDGDHGHVDAGEDLL